MINLLAAIMITACFGDSLTRGGDPANPLNTGVGGYPIQIEATSKTGDILNCGWGGENTNTGAIRLSEILDGIYIRASEDYDYSTYTGKSPNVVFLMEGTNDILQGISESTTISNLRSMCNNVLARGKNVILATIPPGDPAIIDGAKVLSLNLQIRILAAELDIPLVDVYGSLDPVWTQITWDGLHISADGNRLMAAEWMRSFNRYSFANSDYYNKYQLSVGGHTGGELHTAIATGNRDSRLTMIAGPAGDSAPRFSAVGAGDATESIRGWLINDFGSDKINLQDSLFVIRWNNGEGYAKPIATFSKDSVIFHVPIVQDIH